MEENLEMAVIQPSHFTLEETEAQRGCELNKGTHSSVGLSLEEPKSGWW